MPGKDSSPAPRRKKLVLRKIAVDGSSIPETWSGSYTGPLPEVRPPPRPSSADLSAEAEPEAVSEMMIESTMVVSPAPRVWAPASPEAWAAAAAMTPAMPQTTQVVSVPGPEFYPEPVPVPSPSPSPVHAVDAGARVTVAPVVATLPPPASVAPMMLFGRARLSLDSKVLFAGGALATSMLLVALGVFLGVHSKRDAGATQASAQASSIVSPVSDPKALVAATAPPAPAVELPPAAAILTAPAPLETTETPGQSLVAVLDLGPATVDISQLPPAPPPRPRGTARVASTAAAAAAAAAATHQGVARAPNAVAGWTVPGTPAASAQPTDTNAPQARAEESTASSWTPTSNDVAAAQPAASAPEPPAVTPSAVDPLVQAVREDIREDEARAK